MSRPKIYLILIACLLVVGVVAVVVGPRLVQRLDWQFGPIPLCAAPAAEAQTVSGRWSAGTAGPTPRGGASFAVLDDRIYQAGGFVINWQPTAAFDVYDPATDSWQTLAALPVAVHRAGLGAAGGKIYLFGGFDAPIFWDPTLANAWVYDPSADRWSEIAPMPAPRAYHTVVTIQDKLYLVGGQGPDPQAVWVYDPAADTWDTSRSPLPEPLRDAMGAAVFQDKLYLFGGRWREQGNFGMVSVYDPAADAWETRADMPAPRSTAAVVVIGDQIHLVGGQNIDLACTFATHEIYDPAADTWTQLPPMLTPRHSLGAALIDGQLYAVAGATGAGPRMQYHLSSVVEVFTPGN